MTNILFGFLIYIEAEFEEKKVTQLKPFIHVRVKPPKTKKDAFMDRKGKSETYSIQNKDIKYFKCLGMSILFFSVQTKSYINKRQ